MSIYQERGYSDRNDYLNSLVDEYGVDAEAVSVFSDVFGPSEDFDGLISCLEDYADYIGY
jgi:hypothetical protein